jgi:hypothetical protein
LFGNKSGLGQKKWHEHIEKEFPNDLHNMFRHVAKILGNELTFSHDEDSSPLLSIPPNLSMIASNLLLLSVTCKVSSRKASHVLVRVHGRKIKTTSKNKDAIELN